MLNKKLYTYFNHLGFFGPFYFLNKQTQIESNSDYQKNVKTYPFEKKINLKAISDILSYRFMLGDKTLVEGINRSPWLAKPNKNADDWEYFSLKKHQELVFEDQEVGRNLFKLLCEEIQSYIGSRKKVGILLSGGMDSRIVAGCLDYLIKNKLTNVVSVTAYNWGNPDSRDVVYAKIIAKRLGWKYKHYTVTADNLWENFKTSGLRGAEYSGLHLHAITQIKSDIEDEVLLAGSYGDSIGRGEYEGIKVKNLKEIVSRSKNFGGFIKSKLYAEISNSDENHLKKYHDLFRENKDYQQYELIFQLHYMRRLLNPCMEILNEVTPTFQIFTSPVVYQYMWSLHPDVRNVKIYAVLMNSFETKLDDIPWARTGVAYLGAGKPDEYKKKHHNYYEVIENELLPKMEASILSGRIESLNIFNMSAIRSILKKVRSSKGNNNDYLERLTWLVSLDYFLEAVEVSKSPKVSDSILDDVNGRFLSSLKYVLVQKYREFKK